VSDSLFYGNTSGTGEGGGLYSVGAIKVPAHVHQQYRQQGAGIYTDPTAKLEVVNSHFLTNSATDAGGGLYANNTIVVTSSWFISNSAVANGGGVYA